MRGFRRMVGGWRRGRDRLRRDGGGNGADQHFAIEAQDQQAVERLKAQGLDLTKPIRLTHSFVFASQAAADDAAPRLRKRGFDVTSETAAGNGPRVTATKASHIDAQSLADLRGHLTRFARRHGGEYDGWRAA